MTKISVWVLFQWNDLKYGNVTLLRLISELFRSLTKVVFRLTEVLFRITGKHFSAVTFLTLGAIGSLTRITWPSLTITDINTNAPNESDLNAMHCSLSIKSTEY